MALVVRAYAHENPDSPSEKTSYLSVTKITTDVICVIGKVKNPAKANEAARQIADASADKTCLE